MSDLEAFRVRITRCVRETTSIYVEATDERAARREALRQEREAEMDWSGADSVVTGRPKAAIAECIRVPTPSPSEEPET